MCTCYLSSIIGHDNIYWNRPFFQVSLIIWHHKKYIYNDPKRTQYKWPHIKNRNPKQIAYRENCLSEISSISVGISSWSSSSLLRGSFLLSAKHFWAILLSAEQFCTPASTSTAIKPFKSVRNDLKGLVKCALSQINAFYWQKLSAHFHCMWLQFTGPWIASWFQTIIFFPSKCLMQLQPPPQKKKKLVYLNLAKQPFL